MSSTLMIVYGTIGTIVGLPVLMLLKVLGERLGILASRVIGPLFLIPRTLRVVTIVGSCCCALAFYPLPSVLQIFLGIGLMVSLVSSLLTSRAKWFESVILFPVVGCYGLWACFELTSAITDSLLLRILLTSLLWAGPAYFLRSLSRGYIAGATMQAQRSRDTFAAHIVNATRDGRRVPSFGIYLRPFLTDGRLGQRANTSIIDWIEEGGRFTGRHPVMATDMSMVVDIFEEATFNDAENLLAQTCSPLFGLIALGSSDEFLGAGKVRVGVNSWRKVLLSLLPRSSLVFVVLANTPHMIWEINQIIAHDVLERTVFFMPGRVNMIISTDVEPDARLIELFGANILSVRSMVESHCLTSAERIISSCSRLTTRFICAEHQSIHEACSPFGRRVGS